MSIPLTPVMSTRSCHRHEIVKIQKCSFKFKIVIPPATAVKWDKEYPWANNNSVTVQQYEYPFSNIGSVIFRRFLSKDEDYMLVILPQMMMPEDEIDNAETFLTQLALTAGAWIQRRFKLRLGLPEITQKPHYAVVPKEPELVKAFKKGSYKVGEMMGDSSPPDRLSELESIDPRDIKNYLHSINKIKNLEDQLRLLMETVSQMATAQNEFFETMGIAKKTDIKREQEGIDRGIV